ncbi:putative f-box protein [Quercus suber]|uniref:F-box protein n=1 Tax=Quercus suber TaxID=58331 RepID=A0AAW0K3P8_QUESU
MAPKRSPKVVTTAVKATRKVMKKEIVRVEVVQIQSVQRPTQGDKEGVTVSAQETPRTIAVEDKSKQENQSVKEKPTKEKKIRKRKRSGEGYKRAQIQLPPIDTFPDVLQYRPNVLGEEYLIFRAVLSSSPTSNECMAMAIFGEFSKLAFCKYGDNKWTPIDTECQYVEQDFISHEGKFYVSYTDGEIWVGDHTSLPKMIGFAPSLPRNFPLRFNLVRMISGEFFMVGKIHQWDKFTHPVLSSFYKTVGFEVHKFDQSDLKWKEVKNIGDNVFLLCMNNSLSFSIQSFVGCKANCIYFTDDYIEAQCEGIQGGHDMGVYNMGNGSVEPFRGYASDTNLVWPPPIWVFPNPRPQRTSLIFQGMLKCRGPQCFI